MLTEGMYVADRYEILGKIGTGGMSDVYKAKDHILGRFVAIKVLKKEFSEDVNFVTKFRTEAQSAAGLEHPNIVNIYDVGSENGMHFIVMECIEGITLKTYIEKKGKLTYKEAVSIAIQVGRGIEAAHNKNIIHRDIKPQNIIISTEGKVKVTDFGIARAASANTIHSDVMGSVHYTSPEQARNGFVDGKSDIYSLGIVMYEMVTGRVPFDGDSTVAIAIQHLQEEMTPPSAYAPDLPISIEKIIQKCTMKNPDRRYESISDLLVDLKKVLISPDEDFVTIVPLGQEKTRVIAEEDVETIKKETNGVYYTEEENEEEDVDDEEEDDEEEDEEDGTGILNPKMEKAVTIMGIVAAVIIVIIIICILGSITGIFRFGGNTGNTNPNQDDIENTGSDEDEPIIMINLLGKTEKEARAELKKIDLGLRVGGMEASDKYEKGEIISQDIAQGEEVEKNTMIVVTICSGPGEFAAPNVVGQDESRAKALIEDKDLEAKRDYAYDDEVEEGKVISQSPEAGTLVEKGDTITYVVSMGREEVEVPDVVRKTEEDAKKALEELGIEVGEITREYNDMVEGNVISQSIDAGEKIYKGESVDLVISLGKKPTMYSYTNTYKKPTEYNGKTIDPTKVRVYLIELYPAEGEGDEGIATTVEESSDKKSITISATDIEGVKKGNLVIVWEIPNVAEDGTLTGGYVQYPEDKGVVYFKKQ